MSKPITALSLQPQTIACLQDCLDPQQPDKPGAEILNILINDATHTNGVMVIIR